MYKSITFFPEKDKLMIRRFNDVDVLDVGILIKLQRLLMSEDGHSGEMLVKENTVSTELRDHNGTLSGGTQIMSETEKFNKIM